MASCRRRSISYPASPLPRKLDTKYLSCPSFCSPEDSDIAADGFLNSSSVTGACAEAAEQEEML